VVDGVSMGPGLLPGDVVASGWLPEFDRRRPPVRFDRWIVTLPDGSTGLKRVVGLPGEAIAIVDGDLVVDGQAVLKGPRLLAEMGSPLPVAGLRGSSWAQAPAVALDDAPFAPGEVSRLLLPVHDVGFAAEMSVAATAVEAGPVRARATAGPLTVRWRFHAAGRYAVVAGRLDGHAVAAAWPIAEGAGLHVLGRRCLPAAAPDGWDVGAPWPMASDASGDERSPSLALDVANVGGPPTTIERVTIWRDVLLRTAADGVARWSVAADEVFLLGDFPSGSRDSRQFGPLPLTALRQRLGP
jgi:type IV secretory pathway protease TraF